MIIRTVRLLDPIYLREYRRATEEDKPKVKELRQQGMTFKAISEALGISRSAAYKAAK
jgi:DNA invertase Pin-like site-specific DNA recombinase